MILYISKKKKKYKSSYVRLECIKENHVNFVFIIMKLIKGKIIFIVLKFWYIYIYNYVSILAFYFSIYRYKHIYIFILLLLLLLLI